jgi:hypothetical protein
VPASGPAATTLCASGRSTSSHASPIGAPSGSGLPKASSSARPPQTRSMKSGVKVSGAGIGAGYGVAPKAGSSWCSRKNDTSAGA